MKRLVSVCLAAATTCALIWVLVASRNSAMLNSQILPGPAMAVVELVGAPASTDVSSGESQSVVDPTVAAQPTLFRISISPEARVKATAVESRRELSAGQWTTFQITIENAAGITAPLSIESEQLMRSETDTDRDRWIRLSLEPDVPLTGRTRETRSLRLYSRDTGIRTALLNVNAGQGTQDLGFRSDVLLSFHIAER